MNNWKNQSHLIGNNSLNNTYKEMTNEINNIGFDEQQQEINHKSGQYEVACDDDASMD